MTTPCVKSWPREECRRRYCSPSASATTRTTRITKDHLRASATMTSATRKARTRGSLQFRPTSEWMNPFMAPSLEAVAGTCGNRTHLGRDERPTEGFEVLGDHQIPSAPLPHA